MLPVLPIFLASILGDLAAPPNLEVRSVGCNESAIKRWLSSELIETVFSLTHELFMTKHQNLIGVNKSKGQEESQEEKKLEARNGEYNTPVGYSKVLEDP